MKFLSCNQSEYIHNSLFDYDAYDAEIFHLPPAQGTCSLQRVIRAKKTSVPSLETYTTHNSNEWSDTSTPGLPNLRRKMSDPDIHHGVSRVFLTFDGSPDLIETTTAEKTRRSIIAKTPIVRPGRALINPFDPSHVTIKLTSNRRRWTHIFPKGPTGVLIQQHHYQAVPANQCNVYPSTVDPGYNTHDYEHTSTCSTNSKSSNGSHMDDSMIEPSKRRGSTLHSPAGPLVTVAPSKSITYLWGVTGEQEWTPALTTGVDWKSLTIPACLPITTDYFPDIRSLHNDYVVSDYTLLPDDVNSDYANSRAVYRKPLTTDQVFKEIVSARLAQGFQLIVLEDKANSSPPQAPCCGGQKQKQSSLLKMIPPSEPTKEYLLSIGRIFHKISLSGSVITVTGYRPRHPYPPINVDYRYRFHAPHHDTYEISGVNFTTEKLENYNWNYMDHYICTRGDTDYPLLESLKYWRYRMYLLPKEHPATKKILEGTSSRCDIYTEVTNDIKSEQQIDEFLKFVETYLNKIKRLQCRKARLSICMGSPTTQQSHLTKRRHSTSVISRQTANQGIANSPFRERVGSNRLPETRPSVIPRLGSRASERGRVSPAAEATGVSLHQDLNTNDDNDEAFLGEIKLKPNATLVEIFEAMKDPVTGVGFIGPTQSLPSCTFVSWDALNWLKSRLDSSCKPLEILENMRKERMICHASGNWDKPVIPGFYLYYIAIQDPTKDYTPPLGDLMAFENEWMEVEIQGGEFDTNQEDPNESAIPNFLRDQPTMNTWKGSVYKHSHLEIDVPRKSDRIEWGHVKYHSVMKPGNAFEIVVQWVTASGPIVYELIYGWCRKAQQCGFQLVAIPADPIAEPFTEKSDPLRGPIFIPLSIDCLNEGRSLFEGFKEETRSDRMLLFQEAILKRFGFMPCAIQSKLDITNPPKDYQYVHCSGNMSVLIRCPQSEVKIEATSPHEMYITRLVYGLTKDGLSSSRRVGFLWSWNSMIPNKKWKSLVINCSSESELFQLRSLRDFKDFCSNHDRRLEKFWKESWGA